MAKRFWTPEELESLRVETEAQVLQKTMLQQAREAALLKAKQMDAVRRFRKSYKPKLIRHHGLSRHGIYRTWKNMIQRCHAVQDAKYQSYGAKGIHVCEEWLDFKNFLIDMHQGWKPGLTIDRIDPSKGYFKENCRWLTRSDNTRHRWHTL